MARRTDMARGQRFPLEVMLRAMREVDNGVPVSVVCRKVGMVEKTFYRYREKYAGMEATRLGAYVSSRRKTRGSKSCSPSRCSIPRRCGTFSQKKGEVREAPA